MMKLPLLAALLLFWLPSCEAGIPKPFSKWRSGKKKVSSSSKILQQEDTTPDLEDVDLSAAATRRHIAIVSSERIVNKIFDEADTNRDGSVSFREVYELVLKIYITINQQAPIPPPSKQRVLQLFLNADTTHNNKLNREEFKGLANILARRAISRVIAHKLVTLVGAPLLAAYFMNFFTGREWLPKLAAALVPNRYHDRILPVITSTAFCRTGLIIVLVSTLGNIVMNSVNLILDLSLGDADKDQRLQNYKDD